MVRKLVKIKKFEQETERTLTRKGSEREDKHMREDIKLRKRDDGRMRLMGKNRREVSSVWIRQR